MMQMKQTVKKKLKRLRTASRKSPYKYSYKKFLIIGMGMMGTSLAIAINDRKGKYRIDGLVKDQSEVPFLKKLGILGKIYVGDELFGKEEGDGKHWNFYDLIIFAVPLTVELVLLGKILPGLGRGPTSVLITSLSSCSKSIIKVLPQGLQYIVSHPLCGGEESGSKFYKENLFVKKLCFLIPPDQRGLRMHLIRLRKFWSSLGMDVCTIKAKDHDEIMAVLSHIPHLLAGLLTKWVFDSSAYRRVDSMLNSRLKSALRGRIGLAGGGFSDLIRIAGSNPEMWTDIILANREYITPHLQKLIRRLIHLDEQLNYLEMENPKFWKRWFLEARKARNYIWGKK